MSGEAAVTGKRVVVYRLLDKIKWLNMDGVFYVHPDYVEEFAERHGPLSE